MKLKKQPKVNVNLLYKNILKENDDILGKKEVNKNIRELIEKRYKKFFSIFSNDGIEKSEKIKNKDDEQKDENYQYPKQTLKKEIFTRK